MARIIIVDDYKDLQDFFKDMLELNHFEVRSAGSAVELDTLLTTFMPDLILLDVMLGADNGTKICKEIKEKYKEIAIILISANPKLLINYQDCNADDIIEKPFDMYEVLDKINKLLNK
ncbi:MAG TPA: response regulator [Ferruginibacter sp.]|jgi:two-component system phosphate regulon response regulator PhoB|nr:response regulator [Ferruginibacter sp.]